MGQRSKFLHHRATFGRRASVCRQRTAQGSTYYNKEEDGRCHSYHVDRVRPLWRRNGHFIRAQITRSVCAAHRIHAHSSGDDFDLSSNSRLAQEVGLLVRRQAGFWWQCLLLSDAYDEGIGEVAAQPQSRRFHHGRHSNFHRGAPFDNRPRLSWFQAVLSEHLRIDAGPEDRGSRVVPGRDAAFRAQPRRLRVAIARVQTVASLLPVAEDNRGAKLVRAQDFVYSQQEGKSLRVTHT